MNSNSSGTSGRYRYPELFGLRCVILEDYYKSGSEAPQGTTAGSDTDVGIYVLESASDSEYTLSKEELALVDMEDFYIELRADEMCIRDRLKVLRTGGVARASLNRAFSSVQWARNRVTYP